MGAAGGWTADLRRERHYGDRVMACHRNRPASIHAMLEAAVAAGPEREALVDGDTRLSYAGLGAEVARVAGGLAARGIGPGERVALLLGNGAPFVVLVLACARLGAVAVPMSIREQTPGLRHALVNSGARLLVTEADHAAALPPPGETPALRHRFCIGSAEGTEDWESLPADPVPAVDPGDEAPATILYTSGTSGTPKGAVLTHLGIVHSATNYVDAMGLGPADRTVVCVPMSHVTGLVAGIHAAIRAGGTIVSMREFKATRFLALAAAERMSFTVMVPAMYNLCLHQGDLAAHDLSAWRIGGYGGAPMPAPTIARLAEALPGLGLMNAYGATETTSPATLMPAEETASRRLSVGLQLPGVEIAVMDEAGREVPRGTDGEIWIRGANVVPGYWANPEATGREFVAGFWKSGDIGMMDEDGFLHVHDRAKDMINRGGYKIYGAMVEGVLGAVPGVLEAAVIAKSCPVLGERVHAVVSADPARVGAAALEAACRTALADYQIPESWTIGPEPLPRNANGKVLKRVLRDRLGFSD